MFDFLNNISDAGRKIIFGILAFLLLAVFVVVFNNNTTETEKVAVTGTPSSSGSSNDSRSEERYSTPSAPQNNETVEGTSSDDTVQAKDVVNTSGIEESLDFLKTKNSPSGLVPSTSPDEETLNELSEVSVAAAAILEDIRFSPKDRYDALPEFFTMYSTVPGQGFNIESLSGEGAVFTFVGFTEISPSEVVAEVESSDKPEDHRFMEINFDGENWTMLKYYDVHYADEGFHLHD